MEILHSAIEKFTHSRGKYKRKAITESTITQVRYLHVVLYMADRAWSHAMEKRQLPGLFMRNLGKMETWRIKFCAVSELKSWSQAFHTASTKLVNQIYKLPSTKLVKQMYKLPSTKLVNQTYKLQGF